MKNYLIILLVHITLMLTGQTQWSSSGTGLPSSFNTYDFVVRSQDTILAVGADFNSGMVTPEIYLSSDTGYNWVKVIVSGISHNYLYSAATMVGSKYLVHASSNANTYGIYSSFDGSNWTLSNNGIPDSFSTYDFIVKGNQHVYAVGAFTTGNTYITGIYQSIDAGVNWTKVSVLGTQQHNYIFGAGGMVGNKLLLSASNTVPSYATYSSTDGVGWTLANTGIPSNFNVFDFIEISSLDVLALGAEYNGTTFNAGIYESKDGAITWSKIQTTGLSAHSYLYSAGAVSSNYLFMKASNSSGQHEVYRSKYKSQNTSISEFNVGVNLFPNPANRVLNFHCESFIGGQWFLYSCQGVMLNSGFLDSKLGRVELGDIPSGVYSIMLESQGYSEILSFIKN